MLALFKASRGQVATLPALQMPKTRWLELLKQAAPDVVRVLVIYDPNSVTGPGYIRVIEAAAISIGVEASPVAV